MKLRPALRRSVFALCMALLLGALLSVALFWSANRRAPLFPQAAAAISQQSPGRGQAAAPGAPAILRCTER